MLMVRNPLVGCVNSSSILRISALVILCEKSSRIFRSLLKLLAKVSSSPLRVVMELDPNPIMRLKSAMR